MRIYNFFAFAVASSASLSCSPGADCGPKIKLNPINEFCKLLAGGKDELDVTSFDSRDWIRAYDDFRRPRAMQGGTISGTCFKYDEGACCVQQIQFGDKVGVSPLTDFSTGEICSFVGLGRFADSGDLQSIGCDQCFKPCAPLDY